MGGGRGQQNRNFGRGYLKKKEKKGGVGKEEYSGWGRGWIPGVGGPDPLSSTTIIS